MRLFLSDLSSLPGSKVEVQNLGARLVLDHALRQDFGLSLSQAGLKKDVFGKPYFANAPQIHFNLSHSDRLLFCGMDDQPIGVDIEKLRPFEPNLPARFFTFEESAHLKKLSPSEREKVFFQMWTAKESYMKATGRGFSLPLNRILLCWEDHTAHFLDQTLPALYFHHYDSLAGICLCVCSAKDQFPAWGEMVWVYV